MLWDYVPSHGADSALGPGAAAGGIVFPPMVLTPLISLFLVVEDLGLEEPGAFVWGYRRCHTAPSSLGAKRWFLSTHAFGRLQLKEGTQPCAARIRLSRHLLSPFPETVRHRVRAVFSRSRSCCFPRGLEARAGHAKSNIFWHTGGTSLLTHNSTCAAVVLYAPPKFTASPP